MPENAGSQQTKSLLKDAGISKSFDVVKSQIETESGKKDFLITLGDLTEADVDAIVCPANPGFEYAGFGGIQVAIASKSGMETFNEAEKKAKELIKSGKGVKSSDGELVGVPTGFAAATTSGKLERIKSIIHVNNMREDKKPTCDEGVVRQCTTSVMAEADRIGMKSVAFPAIGTGVWGVSLVDSLKGVVEGVRDYYNATPASKISKVNYVVYSQPTMKNAGEMQKVFFNDVLQKLKK